MSKPFNNLLNKMSIERRKRIKIKAEILKNDMVLERLRQDFGIMEEEKNKKEEK